MYYYGNSYGYSNSNPCCGGNMNYYTPMYGYYGSSYGYGAAIILVLFILLVIAFGAGFINQNNN